MVNSATTYLSCIVWTIVDLNFKAYHHLLQTDGEEREEIVALVVRVGQGENKKKN